MALPNDLAPITPVIAGLADRGRPDLAALQPNIGALLHDVARLIRRRFERRARQSGLPLTRHQARALARPTAHRAQRGPQPDGGRDDARHRADRAGAHARQAARGRPRRTPRPSDRPAHRTLWLTPSGWAMLDRVLAINGEIREEYCADLSPEGRAALIRRSPA